MFLKQACIRYIERLWKKTTHHEQLTFLEKSFFLVLCIFEKSYNLFFSLINFYKLYKKSYRVNFAYVFSVGNLSLGGTGKSVFVSFLIKNLTDKKGAVFLRGYQGKIALSGKSKLINRTACFDDVASCGDEAYMLAKELSAPIVVGKNRVLSCKELNAYLDQMGQKIDYLVLDDGYQNHQLKKDYEILLVDARRPFENNHCFPAGRLREKDYQRADIIILTHADCVSSESIAYIKTTLFPRFDQSKILGGKHALRGFFAYNQNNDQRSILKGKPVLVFAGIGSFDNFKKTIETQAIIVAQTHEFQDHHAYTRDDITMLVEKIKKNNLIGAITTLKDWVKLETLLTALDYSSVTFYVASVEFEFLSESEYSSFRALLQKKFG